MKIIEAKKILEHPTTIVITSHRNPDGDAIGSSFGMAKFLKKIGHQVDVIFPSEYPVEFEYIDSITDSIIFDLEGSKALQKIENAKVIFALDYNDLKRVDKIGEAIEKNDCTKFLIDHHLDPSDFADFVLSDTTASSTCELVYRFLIDLGMDDSIDEEIATCLYTGIITDTGSFKYATSPRLFEICSKLLEKGVDDVKLQSLIFDTKKEKQLRLLGHCLANRMEIFPDFATGLIYLTKEDYENFNIQRGDTEGIVNYLLRIKGIKLAAFITNQPKITKISLRSKGDFSVQEMAGKHFNGGGHKNASGGFSYKGLDVVLEKFKSILPKYAAQLNSTNI